MSDKDSRALKLIAKSFSEQELEILKSRPDFVQILADMRTLDDAEKAAGFGSQILDDIKGKGTDNRRTPARPTRVVFVSGHIFDLDEIAGFESHEDAVTFEFKNGDKIDLAWRDDIERQEITRILRECARDH